VRKASPVWAGRGEKCCQCWAVIESWVKTRVEHRRKTEVAQRVIFPTVDLLPNALAESTMDTITQNVRAVRILRSRNGDVAVKVSRCGCRLIFQPQKQDESD